LSIELADSSHNAVGDILYEFPGRICPTVALYGKAHIVEKINVSDFLKIVARDRIIII